MQFSGSEPLSRPFFNSLVLAREEPHHASHHNRDGKEFPGSESSYYDQHPTALWSHEMNLFTHRKNTKIPAAGL
jgi:hypothetical protein